MGGGEGLARSPAHQAIDAVEALCRRERRLQLTEWEAYSAVKPWSLPVAPGLLAHSPAEAAIASRLLDGPVAVKVVSPDIPHKTEMGGLRLGLANPEAVEAAARDILTAVGARAPEARIHGLLVQQMAPAGIEMIASVLRDPSFGPVAMVGIGGIYTELLRDVSFRLAPLGETEALQMLTDLRGYPLLRGARGRPPADLRALAATIVTLGRIILSWPGLQSLELNPLIASPDGVIAVDALARLTE